MPNSTNDSDSALYEAYFQAGITACLRSWSVLRTAVERGWGSTAAANDLRQNLLGHAGRCDPMDIADALAVYMEEEFSITLEDGSETIIAHMVARLYQDCIVQRQTVVLQEVLTAAGREQELTALQQQQRIQVVQPAEYDDEEDDDEDMVMEAAATVPSAAVAIDLASFTPASLAAYGQQPLFGPPPRVVRNDVVPVVRQLGQTMSAATTADDAADMVDDDGFAPVVTRKRTTPQQRQQQS